ncbi:MAG: sigma-70 family RNA polymerase sigma factor [Gemmataceae bacterium]|nr:sigma-70 family RNA polymerase sigma factor [Gemmataceae bacterium]
MAAKDSSALNQTALKLYGAFDQGKSKEAGDYFETLSKLLDQPLLSALAYVLRNYGKKLLQQSDDALQQTLETLWKSAKDPRKRWDPARGASFKTWACGIAKNKAHDQVRKFNRVKNRDGYSLSEGFFSSTGDEIHFPGFLVSNEQGPLDAMIQRERVRRVQEALCQLPEKQQIVLIDKLNNISGKDIAKKMSISGASVTKHYYNGIKNMKEIITRGRSQF